MTAISSVYVMSMGGESPTLSDMGTDASVAPDITIKFHLKNIGRRLNISEDFHTNTNQVVQLSFRYLNFMKSKSKDSTITPLYQLIRVEESVFVGKDVSVGGWQTVGGERE